MAGGASGRSGQGTTKWPFMGRVAGCYGPAPMPRRLTGGGSTAAPVGDAAGVGIGHMGWWCGMTSWTSPGGGREAVFGRDDGRSGPAHGFPRILAEGEEPSRRRAWNGTAVSGPFWWSPAAPPWSLLPPSSRPVACAVFRPSRGRREAWGAGVRVDAAGLGARRSIRGRVYWTMAVCGCSEEWGQM